MYTQNTQTENKAKRLIICTSLQLQAAFSSFILSPTIMAPVEIDIIPRDVVAAPVAHLKIVDKAFDLPLINDTYNEVSRLAAPLSPFVETVKENMDKVTPMLESGFITIKTQAEEKLFPQIPEATTVNIQAKLDTAMEKVTSAV